MRVGLVGSGALGHDRVYPIYPGGFFVPLHLAQPDEFLGEMRPSPSASTRANSFVITGNFRASSGDRKPSPSVSAAWNSRRARRRTSLGVRVLDSRPLYPFARRAIPRRLRGPRPFAPASDRAVRQIRRRRQPSPAAALSSSVPSTRPPTVSRSPMTAHRRRETARFFHFQA